MAGKDSATAATAAGLRAEILKDATAERERIAAAETEARDSVRRKQAAYDAAAAAHREKAQEARAAYQPEPPMPEQPDIAQEQALLHRMLTAKQAVATMEQRALGAGKLRIESEWSRTLPELAEAAREAAAPLQALLTVLQGWHSLLGDARRADASARGTRPLTGPAERMRERLTVLDVLELAEGVDVLESAAPPDAPARPAALVPGVQEEERFISREEAARRQALRRNGGRTV